MIDIVTSVIWSAAVQSLPKNQTAMEWFDRSLRLVHVAYCKFSVAFAGSARWVLRNLLLALTRHLSKMADASDSMQNRTTGPRGSPAWDLELPWRIT